MKQERQFEETLSMLERRPRLLELIRLRLSFSQSPAPTLKAHEAGDEFVVLAGSLAKAQEVPSRDERLKRRREQLISEGTLVPAEDPTFLRFVIDTAFDTPSGAARVVYGGNVSGPLYWRHEGTGQTYSDWAISGSGSPLNGGSVPLTNLARPAPRMAAMIRLSR